MSDKLYPFRTSIKTSETLIRMAEEYERTGINEQIAGKKQQAGTLNPQNTFRFQLVSDWIRGVYIEGTKKGEEITNSAYRASARRIVPSDEAYIVKDKQEDTLYLIYNNDITLSKPASQNGDQIWATNRTGRWELFDLKSEDDSVGPKELFPVVYYETPQKDENGVDKKDENGKVLVDRYLLCPGGNTNSGPTRRIYSLNLDTKKWSASEFPTLPIAMSNFDAVIIENQYKEQEMVCGSGYTEQTTKNVVQFYNFEQEVWRETAFGYNFSGCPLFWLEQKNDNGDDLVVVVGGQSAFYQSDKHQIFSGSGGLTFYGWNITPLWEINVTAGNVLQRYPLRPMNYSETELENEKRFMKTNFKAIHYPVTENDPERGNLKTDFIAFGGTENVSAYNNAVVSYNLDSYVDTIDYTSRTSNTRCVVYPNTELPFGECCVEYVDRIGDEDGNTRAVKRALCIGGRYKAEIVEIKKDEDGNDITIKRQGYKLHNKINWLTLSTKQWANDFHPEIPIPRWNAGSIVLKDFEREIVVNEETGEKQKVKHDLLFLIGGRNEKGLLADVDVLNLTYNKWELDWLDFKNKKRPQPKEGEMS